MKLIFLICFVIGPSFLGQSQVPTQGLKKYRIHFLTTNIPEGVKGYLLYQADGEKHFDSALVQNRQLVFFGTIDKNVPATVVMDHKNLGLSTLMKKSSAEHVDYLKLYLCEGLSEANLETKIAAARFRGPGINHDFQLLQDQQRNIHEQWSTVSRALTQETDTARFRMLKATYDSLNRARLPILKHFVASNPRSLVSLIAWEEYKGYLLQANHMITDEKVILEAKKLFDLLSTAVRNSAEADMARRFFNNNNELKPGMMAPPFSQPDRNGQIIHLSDFRGKYLLLDLWASWCGPCRQNAPALKALYDEFRGERFEILGISLDEKEGRTKWLQAIKDDGLKWPQVSDLRHWDNAVVKLYTVPAIPYYLLIGPDGKIVAGNESIQSLHKKIAHLLALEGR